MDTEGFTRLRKFKSKRNDVYLIKDQSENEYVMKKFKCPEDMKKELEMLILLKERNINVPKVILWHDNTIIMEFIKGKTLLEIFEEYEKENVAPQEIIEELYDWLVDFYALFKQDSNTSVIFGDVNFSNFIVADKIYGIDFEMCSHGEIEQDIGRLCAFALSYSPEFTDWKINFARAMDKYFVKKMRLNPMKVKLAMEEKFAQRGIEKERYARIIREW
jgi:tRNA A-37 threonylcarbamoyl transferase component Bud32